MNTSRPREGIRTAQREPTVVVGRLSSEKFESVDEIYTAKMDLPVYL